MTSPTPDPKRRRGAPIDPNVLADRRYPDADTDDADSRAANANQRAAYVAGYAAGREVPRGDS